MVIPKDLNHLIRNRRSIFPKFFTDKKVNEDIVEDMLENACWAPTHKLTQPWRFCVFKGDGLNQFAEFQAVQYRRRNEGKIEFQEKKFQKLLNIPQRCSHIISIGMSRNSIIPEQEEIAAVSCAVQNMLLTAAVNGIGCYWSTGGVTYYDNVNKFFGLEKKDKLLGFLFIGGADEVLSSGKRKDMKDKIKWMT